MKVNELEKVFLALCESTNKNQDNQSQITSNSKQTIFTMIKNNQKVDIIYHKKASLFIPVSTLYCRIYLDYRSPIYYHLPEIIGFMNNQDFRCCYFPYIENIYRMNACLNNLFEMIQEYLCILESWDKEKKEALYQSQKKFLMEAFHLSEEDYSDEFERQFYDKNYYPFRFTRFDGYIHFLTLDYSKAIQEYDKAQKQEELCNYEKQLVDYMKKNSSYPAISSDCFAYQEIKPYLNKSDVKEFLLCTLFIAIPCVLIDCLIMWIIQFILSRNTLVYCGCGLWFGIAMGILPSIFGGMAFRREIISFIKVKDYAMKLDFDDLIVGNLTRKLSKGVFFLMVLFCLFSIYVISFDSVRFYKDHFDTAGKTLYRREVYEYQDIEGIYYIKARYNDDGDRVERGSYIIHMMDDSYLDLDGYTSLKKSENEILPLLGHEVFIVDSERELEWYK